MELVTGHLEPNEIQREIAELIAILQCYGQRYVRVDLGGNCNLTPNVREYITDISLDELSLLLAKFEINGIIKIGLSELVISCTPGMTWLELCEMSEIHCHTIDLFLIDTLSDRWRTSFGDSYELRRGIRQLRKLSGEVWETYTIPEWPVL